MRKGNLETSCRVEKIWIWNTACVISARTNPPNTKESEGTRDKIGEDFNKNDCKFSSDHVVAAQIWKHACSYYFKEMGRYFYYKARDCLRQNYMKQI